MRRLVRGQHGAYRVDEAELSKGGVGSIHRTDDPELVYKHYFEPQKAPRQDHLERLIAVGRDVLVSQGKKPGDTPESSVNWPIDVIPAVGGGVQGVVLPIIPGELFNADLGNVRTLEFLVMKRARPPQATGRLALLLRMAEILAFVDARGLVHGDVNGKNLAWAISPKPVMYLIDCDGMVPQSPRPTSGVQALGWADPRVLDRVIPAHDHLSDRYALALAMYRGLLLTPGKLDTKVGGRWPEPGRIPDGFPDELAALLRRGLSALDGEGRPAPQEWVSALMAAYVPQGAFATHRLTELDRVSGTDKPRDFIQLPPVPQPPVPRHTVPPTVPQPRPPYRPVVPVGRPGPQPPYQPGPPTPPSLPYQPHTPPAPPAPRYVAGPSGRVGQHALGGRGGWYVIGVVLTFLLSWVVVIYSGIALYQLRSLPESYPGLNRTRVSLIGFAVVSGLVVLSSLATRSFV